MTLFPRLKSLHVFVVIFAVSWTASAYGQSPEAGEVTEEQKRAAEIENGQPVDEQQKRAAEIENGQPVDEEPEPVEEKPDLGPPPKPFSEAGNPEKEVNADDAKSSEDANDFGHGLQVGLRVSGMLGYRMVFRYDQSPFCSQPDPDKGGVGDQQKFCGHVGPPALDLGLSFAVLDSIEPYAWARFGLKGEAETNTTEVLILGVGARIYTSSESAFKIFVEPALGLELEEGAGNPDWTGATLPGGAAEYTPEYKQDFVVHLAIGPHWDFAEQFGAFANLGITVGMLRAIHASMEGSLGVQLRVP